MVRFIVQRDALQKALALIGAITPTNTPRPVLAAVLIRAEKGKVSLAGTDLESYATVRLDTVQVESTGALLVNREDLAAVVAKSEEETVVLDETKDGLMVKAGAAKHDLPTLSAEEFPPIPKGPPADTELPAETMGKMIERTIFAHSKENTRYAFAGLYFLADGKLEVVGTDGRRLAVAKASIAAVKPHKSLVLPSRAAKAVLKACQDAEENATVSIGLAPSKAKKADTGDGKFCFTIGPVTIVSASVPGNFPPYEDVMVKSADYTLKADREAFVSAVAQSAALHPTGLRLELTGKGVSISGTNPESGDSAVKFPCKVEGGDLVVGANPTFLLDGLKAAPGEEVTIRFTTGKRPMMIHSSEYQYVIMPINLDAPAPAPAPSPQAAPKPAVPKVEKPADKAKAFETKKKSATRASKLAKVQKSRKLAKAA